MASGLIGLSGQDVNAATWDALNLSPLEIEPVTTLLRQGSMHSTAQATIWNMTAVNVNIYYIMLLAFQYIIIAIIVIIVVVIVFAVDAVAVYR